MYVKVGFTLVAEGVKFFYDMFNQVESFYTFSIVSDTVVFHIVVLGRM